MNSLLLDTQAWAWLLTGDERLSAMAVALIEKAETILVSSDISVWNQAEGSSRQMAKMQPFIGRLPDLLQEQGGIAAGLTPDIFWLKP